MVEIQGVSSATSPYEKATYSAKSNDKNTLSIESYFKLLSAQLANQDMTSPMDNSEMMAQMTQMAMVQSLGTMTTNMKQEMALTKTSYLAGLIGKEVSAKVPEAEQKANPNAPKEKSGVIASVNLTGDEPSFRLQGDVTDYPLESLLMVRQAGTAAATTIGSAVTAPVASTGTTAVGTSTTAPGETSSTSGTAGASAATAGSATPAAAASTAGASTAGTTGSASTASPATGSASTASPATGSASASSTAGTVSTAGTATTATTGTTASANPAGSSVPPAVAASSSASSSEFGPHVAILEREAAAHSASN